VYECDNTLLGRNCPTRPPDQGAEDLVGVSRASDICRELIKDRELFDRATKAGVFVLKMLNARISTHGLLGLIYLNSHVAKKS
jgi:hypothetical protein